jgi:hypothetical protein
MEDLLQNRRKFGPIAEIFSTLNYSAQHKLAVIRLREPSAAVQKRRHAPNQSADLIENTSADPNMWQGLGEIVSIYPK